MRHRIFHSTDLPERLGNLAGELGIEYAEIEEAYQWAIDNEIIFEEGKDPHKRYSILVVDIEREIQNPTARRLYKRLKADLPTTMIPRYGKNWVTVKAMIRSAWEQTYNIIINKIPSHTLRLAWLRIGGAKIGKRSTIWRTSEILGIQNLVMGEDSVIAWHCQVDARAGLVIGDHVAIASHVLIIAGTHDLEAPEFWSVSGPIRIDDYAWIATRALIGHNSHIGRGAVVTANTVVAKTVPPYKIVGGSGAKPMGERPHNLNYKVGGRSLLTLFY